jgi:thioredoxin reductase (NADPH)
VSLSIFSCAFILRRVELIERGVGDVLLVGSSHSVDTLRIKEFLTRNYHPYLYRSRRGRRRSDLLDHFKVAITELPVMICRSTVVLRNRQIKRSRTPQV